MESLESKKLALLRICQILREESDYDHPMTQADLADRLDISTEEIMALGDGDNDRPMLREAGYSVAMGNAPDFVKVTADFCTLDNENDGAAAAICAVLEGM